MQLWCGYGRRGGCQYNQYPQQKQQQHQVCFHQPGTIMQSMQQPPYPAKRNGQYHMDNYANQYEHNNNGCQLWTYHKKWQPIPPNPESFTTINSSAPYDQRSRSHSHFHSTSNLLLVVHDFPTNEEQLHG